MSTKDLKLLMSALTSHENWLYETEVKRLHDLKRQVEIGWRLSASQLEEVERVVARSQERRDISLKRELTLP